MRLVGLTYLGLLLFSVVGLGLLDLRHRLALFADARRTLLSVGVAVAFFLAWDTAGIALGIFSRGDVPYMTGVELWPEMPVEEPVFLVLLCYLSLLGWRLLSARGAVAHARLGAGPATPSSEARASAHPREER